MDTLTSGKIILGDKEISSFNKHELTGFRREDIGFVFQFYNLIPNLTALENIEIVTQMIKNPLPAEQVLKSVGLEDRLYHFPAQLSGGEQQRVAIARALAKKPKLLLCDEPTGALDYQTGRQILQLLQDQSRQNGMTVVIVTHNSALTAMADRVIRVKSGTVVSVLKNEKALKVEEIEW
jgi:putative ABC transport system ATP-binding protein